MNESNRIEFKRELTDNFLRMVIPSVEQTVDEGGAIEIEGGQIGGQIETVGGAIGGAIKLTPRQNEILNVIRENHKISYRTIADRLKINESAVLKHLNNLKAKGVLERIGGTRGYWQIKLPKD